MTLAATKREFRELPIGLLDAPPNPSRTSMNERNLDELVDSIRAHGILQPLSVTPAGDRYEVLAGHRRLLAAARAGLAAVPCLVYPSDAAGLIAVQYDENRRREELNAADEAIWFSELLEQQCGGDVDALCALLKEKRSYVEGRLLLFQGDARVFEALQDDRIKIGVAHQLNRCTNELHRRYLLHQAIVGGATVAIVSGWIQDWQQQEAALAGRPLPVSSASAPAPVPQTDFFRCYVCGGTDHVHTMQPVNVHGHCQLAILDKLLAAYRGEDTTDGTGPDPRRI